MDCEDVKELLLAGYEKKVASRKRIFLKRDTETEAIQKLAELLTDENDYRFGAMLTGLNGNGKTSLLYAFQELLIFLSDMGVFDNGELHWKDRRCGMMIVEARGLSDLVKNEDDFRMAKEYPILGIDDLGEDSAEVKDYGNIKNPIQELLEYRYKHQLFTIATTNQRPKELANRYDKRVADRMNEMFKIIVFKGDTFRK